MQTINSKDIILLVLGSIIFPIITEFLLPYMLKENYEPVYSVSRFSRLLDYNGKKPENLLMVINDTVTVSTNAYLYEIVFWNNGKKEIAKKDVRSPFKLSPQKGTKFANVTLLSITEPNISGFQLYPENEKYTIDWKYFEPNFGFKVQAIVLGEKSSAPIIEGYVPQHRVKEVNLSFEPLHKVERIVLGTLYVLLSASSIYSLLLGLKYMPKRKHKHKRKKYNWRYLSVPIIFLAFVIWRIYYYFIYSYHPPDILY